MNLAQANAGQGAGCALVRREGRDLLRGDECLQDLLPAEVTELLLLLVRVPALQLEVIPHPQDWVVLLLPEILLAILDAERGQPSHGKHGLPEQKG